MRCDRILLVDDDPNILASLSRHLHRQSSFDVHTAEHGDAALQMMKEGKPFSLVVSDYRMPGMDGVEFLTKVQEMYADTTRIMLTGQADMDVALRAVNRGQIFRFLKKPIPPDEFLSAVMAGVEQNRLISAEKELIEELSIMQRIDRELNTSLDIHRTMDITLAWAMRQSGAVAGLVGSVQGENLRIIVSKGFRVSIQPDQEKLIPLATYPPLMDVVEQCIPQHLKLGGKEKRGLLNTPRSQIIFPIIREKNAIGILLLEKDVSDALNREKMSFLWRLCDHASIAISNAQLYSAVRAANQAKSEFVSMVVHELRNPMTSIIGFTDMLSGGKVGNVNEIQSKILGMVMANIQRMINLVVDLADISHVESGLLRLNRDALNLKDVVNEVVLSMQNVISEKQQQLITHIPEELPLVFADRLRVAQIITNLVSNAHKYTPREGVILLVAEASENRWDENAATQVVHLWVKDSGIGIRPENHGKIFEKFYRANDPEVREVPGTGLGLSITKNLVEIQGGKIWFESEFRKGTTFHFTLPVATK